MRAGTIRKQYAAAVYLDYINHHACRPNSEYPRYLKEELHVTESRAFVRSLQRSGYVMQQEEQLALTERGREFLQQHEDYARFFALGNGRLSIRDFAAEKAAGQDADFTQTVIGLLQEKIREYREKDDYEAVRDLHLDLAGMYEQAGRLPQALYHYIVTLYLDVSGLEYYDALLRYIEGKCKKATLLGKFDFIYFCPEVQAGIRRLKDCYDEKLISRVYKNHQVCINLCNKARFGTLVTDIMNDTFSEGDWQKYFRETFGKMVDTLVTAAG